MAVPTDQELLDAYREALLALASAQSYTMPNGRSITRADMAQMRLMVAWLESRIAAAKNPGDAMGIALVSNY